MIPEEGIHVSFQRNIPRESYEHLPTRFAEIDEVKDALRGHLRARLPQDVINDVRDQAGEEPINFYVDIDELDYVQHWEFTVTTPDSVEARMETDADWNTATLTLTTNIEAT